MHVIFITPEVAPYSGTGAVAEYCSAMPLALRRAGLQVTVIAPFYANIEPSRHGLARRLTRIPVQVGDQTVEVGVIDGKFQSADVSLLMVDHKDSFTDPAALAGDARACLLLCAGALGMVREMDLAPDLIHAVGGTAGLVPQLRGDLKAPVVYSLLDAGDAASFAAKDLAALGVDAPGGSLAAAGLAGAAGVTTASPAYARELTAGDSGLKDSFADLDDRLTGVLPGVEASAWDPSRDHRLAATFGADDLSGKAACKAALQEELGLALEPARPLLALVDSAGAGLALEGLEALAPEEAYQLVLVGGSDPERASAAAAANPKAVAFMPALKKGGLRRLLAGADASLHAEDAGPGSSLVLAAMRYAAVPVCHAVGLYRDAVVNFDDPTASGTGITFGEADAASYTAALQRFIDLYKNEAALAALRQNAMRHPFTWDRAADLTNQIYATLL